MISVETAIQIAVFIGLLYSLVLHEIAHAVAAKYFGDDTAYQLGRITLDPISHIDPMMTIVVPLLTFFASNGQSAFGGAKPVPVNTTRLRNPRRDMMWIAAAGPITNILIAAALMLTLNLMPMLGRWDFHFAQNTLKILTNLAVINVWLAVFNMIPIPPLDGSKILAAMLPEETAEQYMAVGFAYGMTIVAVLVLAGATRYLEPIVFEIVSLLSQGLLFVRFTV